MRHNVRQVEGGFVSGDAYPTAGQPADWRAVLEEALSSAPMDDITVDALTVRLELLKQSEKHGWTRAKVMREFANRVSRTSKK